MHPLQLEALAHQRQADHRRAAAHAALVRAVRRSDHPSPDPLPPLPRSPRLRDRLRHVRALVAGTAV